MHAALLVTADTVNAQSYRFSSQHEFINMCQGKTSHTLQCV